MFGYIKVPETECETAIKKCSRDGELHIFHSATTVIAEKVN